jgi:hypothetical protein
MPDRQRHERSSNAVPLVVAHHARVLKMDVRKYFHSVDYSILKEKLRRRIKCRRTLNVADRMIDAWCETDAP